MVEMIGFGVIIPVIPSLIMELTGEGIDKAVIHGLWLTLAYAGTQFLFAPFMGELSDRFGRRPILLSALFVLSIDFLLHAYAPTLAWLFVGRFVAGFTGASYTVASAYIADISTPENKAKNFGVLGAAFGLGFIIGPAIGGIFGVVDIRLPFLIAAGLTFANFLFGLFLVPESLAPENRRDIDVSKMIPGVSLFHLRRFSGIGLLVFAFFLVNMAGQVLPAVWSYFTIEAFNWSEAEIGWSLVAVGALVSLVQGLLIGKAVDKWGPKTTIKIGFCLWTIGMVFFSMAMQPWMLYAFLIPYALGGIAGPTLQSLISNQVPENEQGNLQGSLTGLTSITTMLGYTIYMSTFSYFVGDSAPFYFPGASFALAALLLGLATIIVFIALKRVEDTNEA